MSAPRITSEIFSELQRRAERRGIRLCRSESNGVTAVFVDGRQIESLDDFEAFVNAVSSPWDAPIPTPIKQQDPPQSQCELAALARQKEERMGAGAASLQALVPWDANGCSVHACKACGKPVAFADVGKCPQCTVDERLCAKLVDALARTSEGIAEAAIKRAARP